jgi:hypothetical protein
MHMGKESLLVRGVFGRLCARVKLSSEVYCVIASVCCDKKKDQLLDKFAHKNAASLQNYDVS